MKTTKEMIEVMQAFDRGEQIQVKTPNKKCEWEDIKEPNWQWNFCDYRVKPKKKYVPFDTSEEFLAAQRVHGGFIKRCDYEEEKPLFALVNYEGIVLYTQDNTMLDITQLFGSYTFLDGTPCGKEVEV